MCGELFINLIITRKKKKKKYVKFIFGYAPLYTITHIVYVSIPTL